MTPEDAVRAAYRSGIEAGIRIMREAAVQCCDVSATKWHTDYKIGHGPHRASAHREGMSDGADECSREIAALPELPIVERVLGEKGS